MEPLNIDWEKYRRADGSIDLREVFYLDKDSGLPADAELMVEKYFELVEAIRPIHSRQVAAVAVATGAAIVGIVHNL